MTLPFLRPPPTNLLRLLSFSLPALFSTMATTTPAPTRKYKITPYTPHHATYSYDGPDFLRQDESPDTDFYATPRFVTHIDDHAIALLREYYLGHLPRRGRVLDLCSSWVSHFPSELEEAAKAGEMEVVGVGLNGAELAKNTLLKTWLVLDLNRTPAIPEEVGGGLDACVCVVSIDYLTQPVRVLESLREKMRVGGVVHLVVSNRCFPTKAVGRWLRSSEDERLEMVGNYLWWSGWRGVEIVEVCDGRTREGEEEGGVMGMLGLGRGRVDPLWVVRGVKVGQGEVEDGGRSEL